jgi:hypothetical protein
MSRSMSLVARGLALAMCAVVANTPPPHTLLSR